MASLVPTSSPSLTLTSRFHRLTSTIALRPTKSTATSRTASHHRRPQWICRKKDIHPEFLSDAKVYCNGELVMTTGGTQEDYNVDVWSGNHPFYLGKRTALLVDADQVEKFRKKFGEMAELMEIPVLKGEIVIPPKRKSASGKGGKKK